MKNALTRSEVSTLEVTDALRVHNRFKSRQCNNFISNSIVSNSIISYLCAG